MNKTNLLTKLLLLCLCVVGSTSVSWAANKTFTVQGPAEGKRYVQDNILITGSVASRKIANTGSQACFNLQTGSYAPMLIISKAQNIKAVEIYGNRDTSGNTPGNAFNVFTSSDALTFATPTSGFTAVADNNGNETAVESLTNVQMIGNNQSYATTITINFTTPVMAVRLTQSATTSIRKVVVTYDDAITVETQLCEVHMTSATEFAATGCTFTKSNIQSGNTLTDTESTPNTYYYDKTAGCYGCFDLGTGNTFEEGDEIWFDVNGNGHRAYTGDGLKLNKENSADNAVNINPSMDYVKNMPIFVRYVTQSTDPWCGEQKLFFLRQSSNIRLYQITIHRHVKTEATLSFGASSVNKDFNSVTSFTLPTVTASPDDSAITDNISYTSSNEDVATLEGTTVNLLKTGTSTITASFAGDEEYTEASTTYVVNVYNSTHSQFGYTESISGSTLLARSLSAGTHSNIALAQTKGSNIQNYAGTSTKVYIDQTEYSNTDTWYNSVSNTYDYVGYDVTIDDGYALDLSKIDVRLAVGKENQSLDYLWYVEILDKNNAVLYTSDVKTSNKTDETTPSVADYFSATKLTGTVHVRLYVQYNGTYKEFSIEKMLLTGKVVTDDRPDYTISFASGTGSGTVPDDVTVKGGETFTLPAAPLLYKNGNTLTKWNDGKVDHAVGSTMEIDDDVNLTAVFDENTVNLGDAEVNVNWTFQRSNGCPAITNLTGTGATKVYSKHVEISDTPYDALMTIDATSGKFDNSASESYAQVNAGTKFTIPAVYNMVVTYTCTQGTPADGDITVAGENAKASGMNLTYTYKGVASTVDIVAVTAGRWPSGISVTYPVKQTKYATPTIAAESTFNFEHKGYKVTITDAEGEGTLEVSEDGGDSYTAQTSPYVTYATSSTSYKAKVTGVLTTSDIASENVTNTFNIAKPYVAWVYTMGYGSKSYAFATDPMVIALQAIYNVVEVNSSASAAPSSDLSNADLIVCTEAMSGGQNLSNGMKAFAGETPMIGLKAYNYTKGRWSWGTPANPSPTAQCFKPKSALYKVLDGVTFESDGSIKLATTASGNVIQTVEFGTTDTTTPEGNVIMGNLDSSDAKAVMYTSTKYFGLGLSCDCWSTYTPNTIAIIKNAAAMLIAGEDLDAEMASVSGTINTTGWNTFSSSYPLDLSTISGGKAYYAESVDGTDVVLKPATGDVPAGEGLMIKGTTPGGTFTIDVADTDGTTIEDNKLVGLPSGGTVAVSTTGSYNYVYAWQTANPSTTYGFYNVNSKAATLGAGKAYLHLTSAIPTSGRVSIIFDDEETTGIKAIDSSKMTVDSYYDLSGRKVAQPQKGLYIVNGKKVIVK